MLVDMDGNAASKTAADLSSTATPPLAWQCDVADAKAVEQMAETCREALGGCDMLFNNAGIAIHRPLIECTAQDWHRIFAVNVMGLASCSAAVIPMMAEAGGGRIVNIASMAGLVPLAGFGIYSASKHAVVGYSAVLAEELASLGIAVSTVSPGWIATSIQQKAHGDAPPAFAPELCRVIDADEAARTILSGVAEGQSFIATHPEWRDTVSRHYGDILHSFSQSHVGNDGLDA